jgi:hypothetical protein
MANRVEPLNYGIFFANPAQGVAAKAANGGTITLNMTPNAALAAFPGATFLNMGFPYLPICPGNVDLGTSPTPGVNGVVRTPHLVSSGTLRTTVHEVTYFNSVVQTDVLVDYVWGGAMVFDQGSGAPPVSNFPGTITGSFQAQVVTWTGDGSSNRLIPTTFSLATGVVAVWGCGGIDKSAGFNSEGNFFRHNGPDMLGTALLFGQNPVSGAGVDGITGFEAGGFRVSAGSFVYNYGNTAGCKYCAIVISDTTSDNRYLQVGSYIGDLGATIQANVVHLSGAITKFGGTLDWSKVVGQPITITDTTSGTGNYTFISSDATHAVISPAFLGATEICGFSIAAGARLIPATIAGPNSHVWVMNGLPTYKSPAMAGTRSAPLLNGAGGGPPDDVGIIGVGGGGFSVGDHCNSLNLQLIFMVFTPDAATSGIFAAAVGVATGASLVVGGIPFTPALAFARQGSPAFTDGPHWRHFSQAVTPTTSFRLDNPGGTVNDDANGITAIGAASLTLGPAVTSTVIGDPFWWWAWFGGSTPAGTLILTSALPVASIPTDPGLPPNPNPPGPSGPGPLPVPPPTGGDNCPPCITLNAALGVLASRLQDVGMVHWTAAELTRYLREAMRTWNAITEDAMDQGTFATVAAAPFYDLPTTLPALRAYTVTDTYMVGDIEYALMEPPTPAAWTGTAQFTFQDVVTALQQRRDQYLLETGQVVTRVIQALAGPPASGRFPLNRSIVTLRRVAFIDANGVVYPLQRDDEWGANGFDRTWPLQTGVPLTSFPMAYSIGVSPPLICQIIPPLATVGTLDMLAVTRAAVMGGLGPCLDPTVGIFLGVPDDWTWVVRFGALATLLNQQGVTYDPQRAAYCEGRFRHGVLLASKAHMVLAARIDGQPVTLTSIAEADQYSRSWQRISGAPVQVMLAGQALVALTPVPIDGTHTVTLDLVRNVQLPVVGTDCTTISEGTLDPIIGYAMHLAMFKEGPSQLQAAMDLMDRFFRAAGIDNAIDYVSSPNQQVIRGQTQLDESQLPRILTPPPISLNPGGGGDTNAS